MKLTSYKFNAFPFSIILIVADVPLEMVYFRTQVFIFFTRRRCVTSQLLKM